MSTSTVDASVAAPPKKAPPRALNQIPDELAKDPRLLVDLQILPSNYNFEIIKTIWKIQSNKSQKVGLQMPEGLLIYSTAISDILCKYTGCETVILGDVTYGACCVDDLTAKALGCDLLVHYGHSCLVPIQQMSGIQMLYVFVDIQLNVTHAIETIKKHFEKATKIAIVSTIQFVRSIHDVQRSLNNDGFNIIIPQCKPLSPGEILGCTSPKLPADAEAILYLGDGRFHLESIMISNPAIPAYAYDPYNRQFTREHYDFKAMKRNRLAQITTARRAKKFGLILGTLGRQGNNKILEDLEDKLGRNGKEYIKVLMSEIFPGKLALFADVECWIQVACPRLSIDWGTCFNVPLLSPYELAVALNSSEWTVDSYPMDYYANDSLGPWTNNNEQHRPKRIPRANRKDRVQVAVQMQAAS